MLDNSIALELGVTVEEYIEKIENMPYNNKARKPRTLGALARG